MSLQKLKPDFEQARNFLRTLGGGEDVEFTFQTFDDKDLKIFKDHKKRFELTRVLHGTFDEVKEELAELNRHGAGIFVTVNRTDGSGNRDTENIVALRSLFVDKDNGNLPETFDLHPSIIVQTKQGQHAYWPLNDDKALERFKPTQKALIEHFQTDKSVHDLPRVMRVPGFFHMKNPEDPLMVFAVSLDERRFTIDEVVSGLGLDLNKKSVAVSPANREQGKIPDGERNTTLTRIAGALRGRGLEPEQLFEKLSAINVEQCVPPLDESEVRRIADSIGSKDPGPYFVDSGQMLWRKPTKDGYTEVPLSNFSAKIEKEEVYDDGATQNAIFKISGSLCTGESLRTAEVPGKDFSGMGWVPDSWGAKAVVFAGSSIKDNLRVAIQMLSTDLKREVIYRHIGWRNLNGEWHYLFAGGAITKDGIVNSIQVRPDADKLDKYSFRAIPTGEELKERVIETLGLLDLAPHRISFPLLAAIFRAPLSEALPSDFALFISGPSGTRKSEITAIAQGYYGSEFSGRCFPSNWASTANSLEKTAFLAKDALFTIDDFAPAGTQADVDRLHGLAERVFRGAGNQQGRKRMNADGTLRAEYYPRGLILSTGEDVPKGYSLRARTLILDISPGDVDIPMLTHFQKLREIGNLADLMAAYIQWLCPQMDSLRGQLKTKAREMREQFGQSALHGRTPDIAINLFIGLEMFAQFAREVDAIAIEDMSTLVAEGKEVIWKVCTEQTEHQKTEDPPARFLSLLKSATLTGKAHLVSENGLRPKNVTASSSGWMKEPNGTWIPQGRKIGWVTGEGVFLEPEAAWLTAQTLGREQNEPITVAKRTLLKRLTQRELTVGAHGKNTVKKTLEGERREVIQLKDPGALFQNRDSRDNGDES